MTADTDTVWIPAVPLPFYLGWRRVRCTCGETFKGRDREHVYEIHYRRAHQRGDANPSIPDDGCSMSITRGEARALYAEVNADTTGPPDELRAALACPPPESSR